MSSRRSRRKDKKHNDRLRDEAVEALADGRTDRARKLLGEALARAPSNARYWLDLAKVEREAGRARAAERALERSLALSQDYDDARALLAELRGAPPDEAPPVADEPAFGRGVPRDTPAVADEHEWSDVDAELCRTGLVRVQALSAASTDRELREALHDLTHLLAGVWAERFGSDPARVLNACALEGRVLRGDEACEVLRRDLRPGRPRIARLALRPGDVALVCTARRPVRVGGVWGWQPVELACEGHPPQVLEP